MVLSRVLHGPSSHPDRHVTRSRSQQHLPSRERAVCRAFFSLLVAKKKEVVLQATAAAALRAEVASARARADVAAPTLEEDVPVVASGSANAGAVRGAAVTPADVERPTCLDGMMHAAP
jgi:hypothetical protein